MRLKCIFCDLTSRGESLISLLHTSLSVCYCMLIKYKTVKNKAQTVYTLLLSKILLYFNVPTNCMLLEVTLRMCFINHCMLTSGKEAKITWKMIFFCNDSFTVWGKNHFHYCRFWGGSRCHCLQTLLFLL